MVPLGLWFVPGGQLCVIGGDLGVLVLGPAAMFAVLVVLAITTHRRVPGAWHRGGRGWRRGGRVSCPWR